MGEDHYVIDYNVDICIVINLSATMAPKFGAVKKNALDMYELIREKFEAYTCKTIKQLRVRVIGFRDFAYDGDEALVESRFFRIPEEEMELRDFVDALEARGGGNEQSSALEAIAAAMRSDWVAFDHDRYIKPRHVILVYTDTPSAPLNDSSKPEGCVYARIDNPSYPANMPKTMGELSDMWDGISQELPGMPDQKAKRLILFAPDAEPWNSMVWENTWIIQSKAGEGLSEEDMEMTLEVLRNSTL